MKYCQSHFIKSLASGCVCAGGTLGILIPPSIMLILYAPMAGVSVLQMFAGAVVPGLLLGGSYIVYILIRTAITPSMGPSLPPEEHLKIFTKESLVDGIKYLFPAFFTYLSGPGVDFFRCGLPDRGRCRRLHRGNADGSGLWAPYLGNI